MNMLENNKIICFNKFKEILSFANSLYSLDLDECNISLNFGKIGRAFGIANYSKKRITLNQNCLMSDLGMKALLENTIAHEVAHIVTDHLFKNEKQHHSKNWKRIAISLGCDGKRCSKAPLSVVIGKDNVSYVKCNCKTHEVSKRKYNNIVNNNHKKYICTLCKSEVRAI